MDNSKDTDKKMNDFFTKRMTDSQFDSTPVPYHCHTGTDSPQISYNDLTDKPSVTTTPFTPTFSVFGDGSDGAAAFDGSATYNSFSSLSGGAYTLSRDIYLTTATVASSSIISNGYRIFCTISFTLNSGGSVQRNGSNGSNGAVAGSGGAGGGAGGGAVSDGYIKGTSAGGAGASTNLAASPPHDGAGAAGVSNSIGVPGSYAGNGGNSGAGGVVGAGGAGGNTSSTNVSFVQSWNVFNLLDITSTGATIKITGSGSGGGGGGGKPSSGLNCSGGAGGGGGSAGGIIAIFSKAITLTASTFIYSNGGNGGTGGTGGDDGSNGSGGGGGGGGAAGGVIILAYKSLTNNGTLQVNGGSAGSGGGGGNFGGGAGSNGIAGLSGVVYKFSLV